MGAADTQSPATSAWARRGRRELMGRDPVIPVDQDPAIRAGRDRVMRRAMDLSRPQSTKRQATTRRRPSYTGQLITDPTMVRAGVGDDVGGGRRTIRKS